MAILQGKRGLIFGLANARSIAWGIAQSCHAQGAQLGFSYLGETLEKRVRPLAEQLHSTLVEPCDLTKNDDLERFFGVVREQWGTIDFMVHSVAFAKKEELKGSFYDTSPEGFRIAMETSVFTLASLCRHGAPLMPNGGSIVALSYLGAERVIPHYNVMGVAKAGLEASVRYLASDLGPRNIRVNAISAGPIKTLAASAIGDFKFILDWNQENAPLRRNVTIEEVGDSTAFLLSPLARGITGEVIHVDAGYHIIGIKTHQSQNP
jgi:enoyl-[acyl-carrier protein] reductase I